MRKETRRRLSVAILAAASVIGVGFFQDAKASFVTYTSRSTFDSLGPFVAVDWGAFGPAITGVSTPEFRNVGGLTVEVASSQGVLDRRDEGNGFLGTFAPGDHLLTDDGSASDDFAVSFGSPVKGFGTQIDSRVIGPYTGFVEVFSKPDTLLFTANFSGNNTLAEDNSAPFLGIVSSIANIDYAFFWINQTNPDLPDASGALAINRLDVLQPVPEPETLALFAPIMLISIGVGLWGPRLPWKQPAEGAGKQIVRNQA